MGVANKAAVLSHDFARKHISMERADLMREMLSLYNTSCYLIPKPTDISYDYYYYWLAYISIPSLSHMQVNTDPSGSHWYTRRRNPNYRSPSTNVW